MRTPASGPWEEAVGAAGAPAGVGLTSAPSPPCSEAAPPAPAPWAAGLGWWRSQGSPSHRVGGPHWFTCISPTTDGGERLATCLLVSVSLVKCLFPAFVRKIAWFSYW